MYPADYSGITISGLYIHEPGGVVTNAILAAWGFVLWYRLKDVHQPFSRDWGRFLLLLALAALVGALTHGIPHALGQQWFYLMWSIKNIAMLVANYIGTRAFLRSAIGKLSVEWTLFLAAKAVLAAIAMLWIYNFVPVAIDLGITYIILLTAAVRYMVCLPPGKWFIAAFGTAVLSGFSYVLKLDLDPLWMTHKDIVHIFALFSMWSIYKGSRMADRVFKDLNVIQ